MQRSRYHAKKVGVLISGHLASSTLKYVWDITVAPKHEDDVIMAAFKFGSYITRLTIIAS